MSFPFVAQNLIQSALKYPPRKIHFVCFMFFEDEHEDDFQPAWQGAKKGA
jgi:hypothetical protein